MLGKEVDSEIVRNNMKVIEKFVTGKIKEKQNGEED